MDREGPKKERRETHFPPQAQAYIDELVKLMPSQFSRLLSALDLNRIDIPDRPSPREFAESIVTQIGRRGDDFTGLKTAMKKLSPHMGGFEHLADSIEGDFGG
jgi:hypothetical protein